MNTNFTMFVKPFSNHQSNQQSEQQQPFYSQQNFSHQQPSFPNEHYWQQYNNNNNNNNNTSATNNNSYNNNNNFRPSCSYKFDKRKISVHENFYNYTNPYEQRARQTTANAEVSDFKSPTNKNLPLNDANQWFPPNSNSQRKLSMPEPQTPMSYPQKSLAPPSSSARRKTSTAEMMLSPPMSAGHVMKMETPSSPMEVDVVRKTSIIHERPAIHNASAGVSNPTISKASPQPSASYQQRTHPNITTRKASLMAAKSQLRAPRFGETTQYTPPPILSPMRNGSGLFWQIAKSLTQNQTTSTSACSGGSDSDSAGLYNTNDDVEMSDSPGLKVEEVGSSTTVSPSESIVFPPIHDPMNGFVNQPHRKNGFFYMNHQPTLGPYIVGELEGSRKISVTSTSSQPSDEFYVKSSEPCSRKESSISIGYEVEEEVEDNYPRYTDATAHINRGPNYQAKVYKWREREISKAELDQLPDRDQLMFSPTILEGLDPEQIKGFELLSCSQAVPSPGCNLELALHLLMENRGNIEAATADLLRSDTLDWQQYPIILSSSYPDSAYWTPEEISSFQDAIYKTEKDFPQVSQEVGSKSNMECVEFYYTWKKCCPDDYRKLRNLRRKRQLLELNLNQMEEAIPMKKCSLDEQSDIPEQHKREVTTAAPYQALQDYIEANRPPSFQSFLGNSPVQDSTSIPTTSTHNHVNGNVTQPKESFPRTYQMNAPVKIGAAPKKGAQPSADGFFHCRLCDKCFEKVKSLNAHMKSHAMKARAEADAKAQHENQLQQQHVPNVVQTSSNNTLFQNGLSIVLPNSLGLTHMSPSTNGTVGALQSFQSVLNQQALGNIVHPRPQHPLLQPTHLNTVLP